MNAEAAHPQDDARPLRIAVVHAHYRVRGGEDSVFDNECALLEQAGHSVLRFEKNNTEISDAGVGARLRLLRDTIWNPATVREIREMIDTFHPDVVHCHNTFPTLSPAVFRACAEAGVPTVLTLHNYRAACLNGYFYDIPNGKVCERCLGRAPLPGICRKCYRGSAAASAAVAARLLVHRAIGTYRNKISAYIALTNFSKNLFVRCGIPEEKLFVKVNVVPEFPVGQAAPALPGLPDGAPFFLFAGRFSPEKNPALALEAWLKLCGDPDAPRGGMLVLAGDGPQREALQARAAASPYAGTILFPGFLKPDALHALMRRATALVFPSALYETMTLSPIEANRCGLPILMSDVVCIAPDIVSAQAGSLFRNGDADHLASEMAQLLAHPCRTQPGTLFPESAPAANLARLLEIYRSVLPRRTAQP